MLLWECHQRIPEYLLCGAAEGHAACPSPEAVSSIPHQHYSLRAKVSGGSTDNRDHGSQHLLLQQRLAYQWVAALCKQRVEREAVEPTGTAQRQAQPCDPHAMEHRCSASDQGPAVPAFAVGWQQQRSLLDQEAQRTAAVLSLARAALLTLCGSLNSHSQQTRHHCLVVVPAALRVLLALQGHAVQALAY